MTNNFSFTLLYIGMLSLTLNCSSFMLNDRREGVIEGSDVFRVYIQFEDYEYRDTETIKKLNSKVLSDSAIRFSDLINAAALQCLIREDRDVLELVAKKKDLTNQVRYIKVGAEEVSAFVDYHLPKRAIDILTAISIKKPDITAEDE